MVRLLVVLIFVSVQSAFAALPIDIVFDIDQTIATRVHPGAGGDLLADPADPQKGSVSIQYQEHTVDKHNNPLFDSKGVAVLAEQEEQYRIYDGLTELMEKLKAEQKLGHVRVSFYSGGGVERNKAVLSAIKLSDGTTLFDLAHPRVLGRNDLIPTGKEGRFSERFKKDLTKISPNLEDVVLVEDVKKFAPDSQEGNLLWMDDRFPFPERVHSKIPVTPELLHQEKNKIFWVTDILDRAIKRRLQSSEPFSQIVQKLTRKNQITPFSPNQERRFKHGFKLLTPDPFSCRPSNVANILSNLLE